MQRFLSVFVLVVFLVLPALQAKSQDYEILFREFDASKLTQADKRFLQTALAFEGHYLGLLDGDWGRLSKIALSRYSHEKFDTESQSWHMASLAWRFVELYERDGWEIDFYPGLGMSVMLPFKTLVVDEPTSNLANFNHSASSLSISMGVHSRETAQAFHNFTMNQHEVSEEPYQVRKTSFAISRATSRDGSVLYTRSNFLGGSWSTIMLSAKKWDVPILNAVSSSISVGKAPSIYMTRGGELEKTIKRTIAAIQEIDEQQKQERIAKKSSPKRKAKPETTGGTGSGFVVSDDGHILTNAHVVEGCSTILVDGEKAELVEVSDMFDLAILKANKNEVNGVAVFALSPAKLNSDVTVVGFPYGGLLGGLNVTRGAVSSLKGISGDATTMQITAPVQSGNSGGPLLASDGSVVGVVVSKLDAVRVADALGDLPQNVNFAIRGEIAKLFLAQNGVNPLLASDNSKLKPENLAEKASDFTAFVECR